MSSAAIRIGQFVEVQPGVNLHYASTGSTDGRLLLCLHGFPEFWYAWRAVLPELADQGHVVAPDLRGFNRSSAPLALAEYHPQRLLGDVAGLIHALGHQRATLIAHDWGGALAWVALRHLPQHIERLLVINAPHPVPYAQALAHDPVQQAASAYMNWLRGPWAEAALAADDFARLAGFFLDMGGAAWFHGETAAQYRQAWAQPGHLTGMLNYYRASPLHPPTQASPGAAALHLDPADYRSDTPVRVLWGDADTALPPTLLQGLDTLFSDLQVEHLPGATHWVMHEQPMQVVDWILRSL